MSHTYLFYIPDTDLVADLACRHGLVPDPAPGLIPHPAGVAIPTLVHALDLGAEAVHDLDPALLIYIGIGEVIEGEIFFLRKTQY